MRIVPGTSPTRAKSQTPGQLPRIDEDHVDGHPLPGAPAAAVVEVEVELLHYKTAAAIHKEGPQRRVTVGCPIPMSQHIKEEGKEDLIQKAMHSEEKKTEQVW